MSEWTDGRASDSKIRAVKRDTHAGVRYWTNFFGVRLAILGRSFRRVRRDRRRPDLRRVSAEMAT